MVGQSTSSIIVQISPVSYDLSGKTVKAVNSKGEELPIKLGKVVPFTGVLSSRAASTTGLYEIPVEGITAVSYTHLPSARGGTIEQSLLAHRSVAGLFTSQKH